jgi:hypothetical protein
VLGYAKHIQHISQREERLSAARCSDRERY